MANRNFKDSVRTLESAIIKLYGQVTFGASGAISSQSCKGFEVAIVADEAGRYTVTLEDSYNSLKAASVMLEGAADTALTAAAGNMAVLRNVDVASKTLDIQLVETATLTDADPTSGTVMYIELTLKNSSLDF